MIVLSLPFDSTFGWTNGWSLLSAAMQKVGQITEVDGPCAEANALPVKFEDPVLTLLQGYNCLPLRPNVWSKTRNVAYGFPEESLLIKRYALNGKRYFDHIVGGSEWCAQSLRDAGLPNVSAIPQGVDSVRFCPDPDPKPHDGFVIYSGGKFELRKSQDIVMQAVGVMMCRHKDVHLRYDWHNPWDFSRSTILATPFFADIPGAGLARAFAKAGIDPARASGSYTERASLDDMLANYRACDVGLFPNRAEAGTNMVLMQVMACGKPVIATYATGHKDVLAETDKLNLTGGQPFMLCEQQGNDIVQKAMWHEPNLEEVIERLEWAYQHALPLVGEINRTRMQWHFTWDVCAQRFHDVCMRT